MTQITVLDAGGQQVAINVPLLGKQDAADAQAVALSNQDSAILGATNSTAAADETANTGLNGVMKGVLGTLRSRLAQGRQAAAGSQAVVLSTEDLALLGATNSTAAADETANTGLNGVTKGVLATLRARLVQGRQAASASQAVVLSTEDLAALGATNSAAATDETANTGLNGVTKGVLATLRARLIQGRQAAASAQAVALSTEDVALVGATDSSAAADETANTGLNGLLKGILATLRARIPASIGGLLPVTTQKTATTTRAYNFANGQRITTSSASQVRSTAIAATEVLLHPSVRGFFAVGDGTVAASVGPGSIPLAADEKFHLQITSGQFISFIRDGSTDGSLTIVPVA